MRRNHFEYAPGNHDCWWDRGDDCYTLDDQQSRACDQAAKLGIHLLLDDRVDLAGARFAGGALWADFRLGAISLPDAIHVASKRMNDYRRVRRKSSGQHKYVRPLDTIGLHRQIVRFLDDALAHLRRHRQRSLVEARKAGLASVGLVNPA